MAGTYEIRSSGVRFRSTRKGCPTVYETFHGLTRKQDIKRKLADWIRDVESGAWAKRKAREAAPDVGSTVGSFLDFWLKAQQSELRPLTWRGYESKVRLHIRGAIGDVRLADVGPMHVEAVIAAMPKLSNRTKRHVFNILSVALTYAVDKDLIDANPCRSPKVKRPRVQEVALDPPERETVERVLEESEGSPYYVADLLAATAGLRRGEALGLRWSDVDLDSATATVRVQAQRSNRGAVVLGPPKTERAQRTVPLTARTVAALKAQKAAQNERRLELGPRWHNLGIVVDDGEGRPANPDAYSNHVRRTADRLGYKSFGPHMLRHFYCTELVRRGVDLKTVSVLAGHTSEAFTLHVYAAFRPDAANVAREVIEEVLG